MQNRFLRLPAGTAGGVKLCGRDRVNSSLTPQQARDTALFLVALQNRLGLPDDASDADYSYSVRDQQSGVEFMAYSAQSGPAYGGSPVDSFMDFERNDYRIKPIVLSVLADFENWIGSNN